MGLLRTFAGANHSDKAMGFPSVRLSKAFLNSAQLIYVRRHSRPAPLIGYGEFRDLWFNNQSSRDNFKQTGLLRIVLGIIWQFAACN
jgi:hypothetical protein